MIGLCYLNAFKIKQFKHNLSFTIHPLNTYTTLYTPTLSPPTHIKKMSVPSSPLREPSSSPAAPCSPVMDSSVASKKRKRSEDDISEAWKIAADVPFSSSPKRLKVSSQEVPDIDCLDTSQQQQQLETPSSVEVTSTSNECTKTTLPVRGRYTIVNIRQEDGPDAEYYRVYHKDSNAASKFFGVTLEPTNSSQGIEAVMCVQFLVDCATIGIDPRSIDFKSRKAERLGLIMPGLPDMEEIAEKHSLLDPNVTGTWTKFEKKKDNMHNHHSIAFQYPIIDCGLLHDDGDSDEVGSQHTRPIENEHHIVDLYTDLCID